MAIVCPKCGEIYFATATSPAPTHCKKCEADLNEVAGVIPLMAVGGTGVRSAPQTKAGVVPLVVGATLLLLSGVLWYVGVSRFNQAKKATATVVQVASLGKTVDVKPSKVRSTATAVYTAGGKGYAQYPGVRGEGATFEVYYLPGQPDDAHEERPWLFLLLAGLASKLGLVFVVRGAIKFAVTRARETDYQKVMASAG